MPSVVEAKSGQETASHPQTDQQGGQGELFFKVMAPAYMIQSPCTLISDSL